MRRLRSLLQVITLLASIREILGLPLVAVGGHMGLIGRVDLILLLLSSSSQGGQLEMSLLLVTRYATINQ